MHAVFNYLSISMVHVDIKNTFTVIHEHVKISHFKWCVEEKKTNCREIYIITMSDNKMQLRSKTCSVKMRGKSSDHFIRRYGFVYNHSVIIVFIYYTYSYPK